MAVKSVIWSYNILFHEYEYFEFIPISFYYIHYQEDIFNITPPVGCKSLST